ncbi:MAG: glycosyltransferase family 2 protein [Lentimicrobium sp.]|jgi:glycosyltransferase involved in cell wall biosynthesis|nr:glycosyltransferase family 2 protein [Lentimicrobium sp.]
MEAKHIYFSIVIPLFNKGKSISSTINSVLNQTYSDFELILVNDGSTDNSVNIVESCDDKRIRLIHQENKGVSAARNRGIQEAKNEWIAFLDADDQWDNTYLEKMQQLIIDFPQASFLGCQFAQKERDNVRLVNGVHQVRGYIENYFQFAIIAPLVHSSAVIVKKSCFDVVGIFNSKFSRGEDLDMWNRLAKNFTLAFEPTLLSYYIQDSDNRACKNIPSLEKFYLAPNLFRLPKYEQKYMIILLKGVLSELFSSKHYLTFIRLSLKNHLYSIIAFKDIILSRFTRKIMTPDKHLV